jgi:hypothetical protein
MADAQPLPTIDFYQRANCSVCDEARNALQQVLEDRARRGVPIARVRYIDIGGHAAFEAQFGYLVPVLVVAGRQLSLTTSYQAIARFLDAVLPRVA